jgi:zinc/manganese transport system substrate-binding protein
MAVGVAGHRWWFARTRGSDHPSFLIIILIMRPAIAIATAAACACLVAACGSSSDEGDRTQVVATTGIVADITERIAGDDADVVQLIPDGASPHDFALSAEDRAHAEDARLMVYNGAGLEAGIPIDEIGDSRVAVADHVGPLLPFGEAGAHKAEEAGEHGDEEDHEQGDDPHVWMDPTRIAAAVPALADSLAEADPEHAGGYRKRADAFAAELRDLDSELERQLAVVPAGDRKLVTSHDALGYFADRYDLEVVATAFPASGPESEASASAIAEVEDEIERSNVPAVFAEESDDPQVLERIAERTGVEVVDGLLVESPGSAGSYVEMLRVDAALIAGALGQPH